jgi:hypothetical protein
MCYGILVIPKDDWICDACQVFGKEKAYELECLLCPVKGGAMKPCLKRSNIDCRIITQFKYSGVTKKLLGEIIQEEKKNQELNSYSSDSSEEIVAEKINGSPMKSVSNHSKKKKSNGKKSLKNRMRYYNI